MIAFGTRWPVGLILGLCPLATTAAAVTPPVARTLDHETRRQIVEVVGVALVEGYIFEDVAVQMKARIDELFAAGHYDADRSTEAFTQRLTADLQSVSRDKHLLVMPPPDRRKSEGLTPRQQRRRMAAKQLARDHGFHRVERLDGNVGYIDLRNFARTSEAKGKAVRAMKSMATIDALIFDLRHNRGGSPSMIQLLASYLFDEPVLLNTIFTRGTDAREELWTYAEVEGRRLSSVPVYVLTSGTTFSAAEAFAYCLQSRGRVTVIGEVTGGGAHRVTLKEWPDLGIALLVPYTRPINPITQTDWEGTGVQPDVEVPASQALHQAHKAALQELLQRAVEPEERATLEWLLAGLEDP